MTAVEARSTEYRQPDQKGFRQRLSCLFLVWLVMLLLGQYRRRHGGTDTLESLAALGMLITIATTPPLKNSYMSEPVRRWLFGSLAAVAAILLISAIVRHGLHF